MPAAPIIERLGTVSTASVRKCTGKSWDEWVAILEKAGARAWNHRELVAFLRKRHRLRPWWQQGVAVGYEIHLGRREVGRNAKGEFSLTATKSLEASAAQTWKLLASPAGLELWLQPLSPVKLRPQAMFETRDGYYGEIRTMLAARRLRMTWQDPNWAKKSVVQVFLVPRPASKCHLVFGHEQLADARDQARLRARWRAALERLALALAK